MATALYTAPVRPSPEILALAAELEDVEGLGHKAALVIAEQMLPELVRYAEAWDQAAQPTCPMCGEALVSTMYWIGGRGYTAFLVCSGDGSHPARMV